MKAKQYRDILLNNGYSDLQKVIEFVKDASISDLLLISEIAKDGLSIYDWRELQQAIDDVEVWEVKKEEFSQLLQDDKDFAKQYEDTDEDFEEWFEEQGRL